MKKAPANHHGGPPTGGDILEARVAKIEATLEHLATREQIAQVEGKIKVLEERVRHLPSKGFIVTSTLTIMAFMTALISFQDSIQAFIRSSGN